MEELVGKQYGVDSNGDDDDNAGDERWHAWFVECIKTTKGKRERGVAANGEVQQQQPVGWLFTFQDIFIGNMLCLPLF